VVSEKDMKFKMAATAGLSLTLDPMRKMFQNASLKPLGQLKPNCPGMIVGRSSVFHLVITINIKNTKFVKDLLMTDAQFRFNQCDSFREEYISVCSPYGPVLILRLCKFEKRGDEFKKKKFSTKLC
jgi:hypothetical protein